MRAVAEDVHTTGFAHLLADERVSGVDPVNHSDSQGMTHDRQLHEPLVLLGYLAMIAPGMELATGVAIRSQRPTTLVAKQAAKIDLVTVAVCAAARTSPRRTGRAPAQFPNQITRELRQ
ncbi:MAG: hypothetical protein IT337_11980 [Thermomicrobiales bacterium]|nr:hypothetical protein [Thermomicrobiales bacterium]